MAVTAHTWTDGEVITKEKLNTLETRAANALNNSYEIGVYETTPNSTTNQIATINSITTRINSLTSVINIQNATEDSTTANPVRMLSEITQSNGIISSIKYRNIPTASTTGLGIVRVGGDLQINENGVLSTVYRTNEQYIYTDNNLLDTELGVKQKLHDALQAFSSVMNESTSSNYNDSQLTITDIVRGDMGSATAAGTFTLTRSPIAITHDQITNIHINGSVEASGTYANKYILPTEATVSSMISSAAPTVVRALTSEEIASQIEQGEEWIDPRSAGLMSIADKDSLDTISAVTIMNSKPISGVDTRASYGYILKEDKDKLDDIDTVRALTEQELEDQIEEGESWEDPRKDGLMSPIDKDNLDNMYSAYDNFFELDSNNRIIGIRLYSNTSVNQQYRVLTFNDFSSISAVNVEVEE